MAFSLGLTKALLQKVDKCFNFFLSEVSVSSLFARHIVAAGAGEVNLASGTILYDLENICETSGEVASQKVSSA